MTTVFKPIQQGEIYFQSEAELQEYCLQVLQSKGYQPESEVWVGQGLRADIVCGSTVYELKKTLNRDELYQAFGQGASYLAASGLKELVIVGQLPTGEEAKQIAKKTAQNLERVNENLSVSFINEDSFWELDEQKSFGFQRGRIACAALGAFMFALVGKQFVGIIWRWLLMVSIEQIPRLLLSILVVGLILKIGLPADRSPRWERRGRR